MAATADNMISVKLVADAAGMTGAFDKAGNGAEKLLAEIQKAFGGMTAAATRAQQALDSMTQSIVKGSTQQAQGLNQAATAANANATAVQNAAKASTQLSTASSSSVSALKTQAKAANDVASAHDKVGHASVRARTELVVLAHELSQGNFRKFGGSVMVLAESLDLMGKIMSPLGIALGALGAIVAVVAAAFIKGATEQAAFNRSLVLTGNYAGMTEDRFNSMALRIAAGADTTVGKAKEMEQALITSGRFQAESLEMVSKASERLAQASGMTAEEVAKEMAKMGEDTAKWATEHNQQYHFADAATIAYIKQLQEQGQTEKAEMVTAAALYNSLGGESVQQLGILQRAWHSLGEEASLAWDAMKGIGKTQTNAQQISALKEKKAASAQNGSGGMNIGDDTGLDYLTNKRFTKEDQAKLDHLTALGRNQADNADLKSNKAATDERQIKAMSTISADKEKYKTGDDKLHEDLENLRAAGKDAIQVGKDALAAVKAGTASDAQKALVEHGVTTQADIDALAEKMSKKWEPKGAKGHKGGGAVGNPAKLDIQDAKDDQRLDKEQNAAEVELAKAQFEAKKISAEDYYKKLRELADNEARMETADLEKQKAAAEKVAAGTKSGSPAQIAALNNIKHIQTEILLIEEKRGIAQTKIGEEAHKASAEADSQLAKAQKMLAQATGKEDPNTAMAGWMAENQKMLETLKANFGATGVELANRLINVEQTKTQMTALEQAVQSSEDKIRLIKAQASLSVAQGNQTSDGAKYAVAKETKAYYDQEEQSLQAMLEKEVSMGADANQRLIAQIKERMLALQTEQASFNTTQREITQGIESSFTTLTDQIMGGTKKWSTAFKDFAKSIEKNINQAVSKNISQMVMGALGIGGGAAGGGIGSLLGGLGGMLSGLFSSNGGANLATANGTSGLMGLGGQAGSILSSIFSQSGVGNNSFGFTMPGGGASSIASAAGNAFGFTMPALAVGGYAMSDVTHLVGENGPELFTPHGSGTITPADATSRLGGSSVVMHITTADANSFRASQSQIQTQQARQLQRSSTRNL